MTTPLGKHLKAVRHSHDLTLLDIEAATGISNAYLSMLENGKIKKPSPQKLQDLAEAYQLAFEDLMCLAGYIPPRTTPKPLRPVASRLFDMNLTADEEHELYLYLMQILRHPSRKKAKA